MVNSHPQREIGPSPTPDAQGCIFCGWENDVSLVHTQLISTLCPLFLQLCLPCSPCLPLQKPLPFVTPQVKLYQAVTAQVKLYQDGPCTFLWILSPGAGVGGRGWGQNTELQRETDLGPWTSWYHHLWEVLSHCVNSWERRRWQDPEFIEPKIHWIDAVLGPFGFLFCLIFHLDGVGGKRKRIRK